MPPVYTPDNGSFAPANNSVNQTSQLNLNDPLERKRWVKQQMVIAANDRANLFRGYVGNSAQSIIYRSSFTNSNAMQSVIFDFDGFLSNPPIVGKQRAIGKGESQKYFSDQLHLNFYRFVRDNGWRVEASAWDKVNNTKHTYAMSQLANLNTRFYSQTLSDAFQGFLVGCEPTHVIRPNGKGTTTALTSADKPSLSFLRKIEEVCQMGWGFSSGTTETRLPLIPGTASGRYTLLVDQLFPILVREDADFQELIKHSDVRGNQNRNIRGYIGTIGNLDIVTVPMAHGFMVSRNFGGSGVMLPGFRFMNKNGKITGEKGFDVKSDLIGRGVIIGQSALRLASGASPDYVYEEYDAKEFSESVLRAFLNVAPVKYKEHNGNYATKVTDYNFGMIHIEYYIGKRA